MNFETSYIFFLTVIRIFEETEVRVASGSQRRIISPSALTERARLVYKVLDKELSESQEQHIFNFSYLIYTHQRLKTRQEESFFKALMSYCDARDAENADLMKQTEVKLIDELEARGMKLEW